MPVKSRWQLASAVFCCFAPIGVLSGLTSLNPRSGIQMAVAMLYSGGIAVAYGASAVSTQRRRLLPAAVFLNLVLTLALRRWLGNGTPPTSLDPAGIAALRAHLTVSTALIIACTSSAYALFVHVLQSEGRRYIHVQTEIRLATEIHAALVPRVSGSIASPHIEWLGVSRPSGEVGGDLVDVEFSDHAWLACVADVSGHGVRAGLLMGMFKAALHATDAPDVAALLSRVNHTLGPLKQSNMFVTAAVLRRTSANRFEYLLAGHPPLLHVCARTGDAAWVGESQLAVGMFDDVVYQASTIDVEPGDLLVVMTDGLIEVFDRGDHEFGREGLRDAVTSLPVSAPLEDFEDRVFERARRHGTQIDDQTLLLIRV